MIQLFFLFFICSVDAQEFEPQTEHMKTQCPENKILYDGKCMKLPKKAELTKDFPGWKCQDGYVQKRDKCIKINIPKNSMLLEDGKTWQCKDGYKAYRGTCQKN